MPMQATTDIDNLSDRLPEMPPEVMPVCDVSRRFVRVLKRRSNGFIEFEFAIGWPELSVELMLPEQDFEAFCTTQKALRLHD